jgi:hypothetical protein
MMCLSRACLGNLKQQGYDGVVVFRSHSRSTAAAFVEDPWVWYENA